jgi:pimeloyl-ACP methyl ester carboxylesterase
MACKQLLNNLILVLAIASGFAFGQGDTTSPQSSQNEPLVLAEQGSFFVGGETLNRGPDDDVTIHQMYVQYQVPVGEAGVPIVMTHGCCLSSKTWETTPDGRMGWDEYFVRQQHPVYLTDQAGRARSGFDATPFNETQAFERFPDQQPAINHASHQFSWEVFRFGEFGEPHAGLQFPIEAVDELYKQMIPDLNAGLPEMIPTWQHLATLSEQIGGAVLVGHSQSGLFPLHAALLDPDAVKGVVSIEPGGTCHEDFGQTEDGDPSVQDIETLAGIPTLFIYGDYLDGTTWQDVYEDCQVLVDEINAAGGNATMWHLPDLGITGNSHMLMQDANSLELADRLLAWVAENVDQ